MMLIWLISLHDISVRSLLKLAGAVPKTLIQPLNKTNTLEHFGGWNPQTEALWTISVPTFVLYPMHHLASSRLRSLRELFCCGRQLYGMVQELALRYCHPLVFVALSGCKLFSGADLQHRSGAASDLMFPQTHLRRYSDWYSQQGCSGGKDCCSSFELQIAKFSRLQELPNVFMLCT